MMGRQSVPRGCDPGLGGRAAVTPAGALSLRAAQAFSPQSPRYAGPAQAPVRAPPNSANRSFTSVRS